MFSFDREPIIVDRQEYDNKPIPVHLSNLINPNIFYCIVNSRAMEDRHSQAAEFNSDDELVLDDEHDFVPHFQRVAISGEDTSGVPLEDLERASRLVIQALELREHHMSVSQQSFPPTTARFLKSVHAKTMADTVEYEDKRTTAGKSL